MKPQSFIFFALATGMAKRKTSFPDTESNIRDFYGQHNGSPVEGVESAKDCAQLCQTAGSSCAGSSWFMKGRKCLLSGSNSEAKREFTVYMEKVGEASDPFGEDEDDPFGGDEPEEDDPFGGDEPEEDDPFGADEPEEDDPFGADEPEVDDPFGADEPEEDDPFGADEPEEDDPFGADEPEDNDTACGCDNCEVDVACGYPDEASPALKGKAYKVFCQKLDDVGGKNIRPPFKVNSVKECIEACSDVPNSQCKRAIWTNSRDANGQRSCWLREWNGVKKVPTKVGSWSSAHVQE
ncbi:N/apple PAN domain protein [Aspergillus oryzae]|uniref:N/apple PAN domain protein n=1 Tax=Aspergillus oryzae TaxID=5062 RepID=A0A1S9DBI9_ASPOZ|nr:N/apple PAN domain protein [Aspergillus oryzae]